MELLPVVHVLSELTPMQDLRSVMLFVRTRVLKVDAVLPATSHYLKVHTVILALQEHIPSTELSLHVAYARKESINLHRLLHHVYVVSTVLPARELKAVSCIP